jgi:hypothetical protein
MQFVRIVFASVLLCGIGCMVPEEGGQQVDQTILDDSIDSESEMVAYHSEETSEAVQSDEDLLHDKDKWVCWFCHKDKDHKDGGDCPEEHCYHAKHPHKDKAKDKARDECEEEHKHGCYFKDCEKSRH